jgi:hypothetical protein
VSRYLTKICDQLVCLLSSTHSKAIVLRDDDEDRDDTSLNSENADSDRLFDLILVKKSDQQDDILARQGFTVCYPRLKSFAVLTSIIAHRQMNSSRLVGQLSPKIHIKPSVLPPRLLHGETTQGFMTGEFKPAKATSEPFSHDYQSARQIRLLF